MKNTAMMMATALGVVVGLLICGVALKLMNKDGKMKTKYDEMQEKVRGKAYMVGFWVVMVYEAVMCVISTGDVKLPFDNFVIHLMAILLGAVVQASYSIWNDGYLGLNTNVGRFALFCVIIAIFNFAIGIAAILDGRMFADGQFQGPFTNIICAVMFIIIGIELFLKKMIDNNRGED